MPPPKYLPGSAGFTWLWDPNNPKTGTFLNLDKIIQIEILSCPSRLFLDCCFSLTLLLKKIENLWQTIPNTAEVAATAEIQIICLIPPGQCLKVSVLLGTCVPILFVHSKTTCRYVKIVILRQFSK